MVKIKIRKYVNGTRKMVEVLEVDALWKDDLPDEYVEEQPSFFKEPGKLAYLDPHNGKVLKTIIYKGQKMEKREFGAVMKFLNEAGERLMEINKQSREIAEEWNGVSTVKI